MDDGRITDSKNDLVSFKDCVIIMTSNIGTKECIDLANKIGFNKGNEQALSGQERSEATKKALSSVFKPEFLNRIDEIVLFNSLTVDIARVIFRMLLQKLNKRCKTEMKVSQEAQELVIQHGFSEAYGAREMKRAFRKMIEIPMARQLLLKERNKRFVVEAKDNAISISSEWQQGAVLKGRREV
jgi:ATP-dependent Clp protease ATP-binding subunit ClpC